MSSDLDQLVGRDVVIDTCGPIVYMGRLVSHDERGFWLENADLHNCSEGHATREQYIAESAHEGVHVNRRRIFVLRQVAFSISAMSDVVAD
ncbi:MAG TPA: hypothetical protein VLM89_10865 [Phycisphaerae bacterium]|nr:hypothetical protein [Phycisphaerae bacterium]